MMPRTDEQNDDYKNRLFSQLSGWKIACDGLETP